MGNATHTAATAVFDANLHYRAFQVHLGYDRVWMRILTLIAAAIVLPLGGWSLWYGSEVLGIFLIVLSVSCGGWAILDGYQIRRGIRLSWQQLYAGEKVAVRFEFSELDLRMEDKESSACVPWSKFRKWREGRGLILAYRTDATFWTLPVEQFEAEVADRIRQHLSTHCRQG